MTKYVLFQGLTATTPTTAAPPIIVDAYKNPLPQRQAFQVNLRGIGACSCTVQPVVSVDGGANWANAGPPISVAGNPDTSLNSTVVGSGGTAISAHMWGGYLTAISGTLAAVDLLVSM